MILILGHLRSGKSSLFESLTNLTGHAKDGIDPGSPLFSVLTGCQSVLNSSICSYKTVANWQSPNKWQYLFIR